MLPVSMAMPPSVYEPPIATSGGAGDAAQNAQVAKDFEGVFVSLLLKELRSSTGGEGLFPGDSADAYGSMFDMFLGQQLAGSGQFGIADALQRYLQASTGSSP